MYAKLGMTVGVVCATLGLAGAVHAQTFQGTINGEPRTWHVLSQGNESTVSISEQGPGVQMVVIQGHAQPNYLVKGTLTINAALNNGKPMAPPDVMFFPESSIMPSYVSVVQSPGEFSIAVKQGGDGKSQVQGQYKGKLFMVAKVGQSPDMNKSIDVSVSFDLPALKMKQ